MGSIFRSERMSLVQIIDRNDAARDVVRELGEVGLIQLRDLNDGVGYYKRTFSSDMKRCEEMQRRIAVLGKQLDLSQMEPRPRDEAAPLLPMSDLDASMRECEAELMQAKAQQLQVMHSANSLKEHQAVLALGSAVIGSEGLQLRTDAAAAEAGIQLQAQLGKGVQAPLLANAVSPGARSTAAEDGLLNIVAGTIPRESAMAFQRVVYRMARGNCVFTNQPIDEPLLASASRDDLKSLRLVPKNGVLIFFSGSVLKAKLLKICQHFGARIYHYPEGRDARIAAQFGLQVQLEDMSVVIKYTKHQLRLQLENLADTFAYWKHLLSRELATLHALNLLSFDVKRAVFAAEGWVPTRSVAILSAALHASAQRQGRQTRPIVNVLESKETPPTYLPMNKFTTGFQGLVNTYGIPRYREVNPGAFAIILFPFLFAIMFGDVGHGSLLLALALYLIANEKKMAKQQLDDIVSMIYGGRYVLLLNALFAIYVGFLYNEAFSVPLGLFRSAWTPLPNATATPHAGYMGSPVEWDGSVYPFGVDPAWHLAANKMSFFNSYKMKVSIVFGVAQMSLGIFLSLLNHLEFKDWRSVWFQFVPEIVFFLSIFGYLVVLIMMKWFTDWPKIGKEPPSLLNTLIGMFMSPGKYTEAHRILPNQEQIQLVLLLVALVSVPLLLIPKPLLAILDRRKRSQYRAIARREALPAAAEQLAESGGAEEEEEEEEEEDIGEVVVHQVIHTIEFVLGSISNTASYLRLWALSLAHAQLSELFWSKVMVEQGFAAGSGVLGSVILFLCFAIWLVLNLCVIMVMENLSSFLHALRLQWVEFQNKFYIGDGKKFAPFSYAALDEVADD